MTFSDFLPGDRVHQYHEPSARATVVRVDRVTLFLNRDYVTGLNYPGCRDGFAWHGQQCNWVVFERQNDTPFAKSVREYIRSELGSLT